MKKLLSLIVVAAMVLTMSTVVCTAASAPSAGAPVWFLIVLKLKTEKTYTVTATATEGGVIAIKDGVISPDGKTEVKAGKAVTYTFTANEGYALSAVLVDGEIVEVEESSYTFENVAADHVIAAIFEAVAETEATETEATETEATETEATETEATETEAAE